MKGWGAIKGFIVIKHHEPFMGSPGQRLETRGALWDVGIESVVARHVACSVLSSEAGGTLQGNPGKWLWERIHGVERLEDAMDTLDPNQKIGE